MNSTQCWLLAIALVLVSASGCRKNAGEAPPVQSAFQDSGQPKLPVTKLMVGNVAIESEVARTEQQMARGMMFRKEMGENEGMLFAFSFPHRASFYMRNTPLPLSCAYIDADGVILEIHDMKPFEEKPITAATDQIQYVLETRQGWFDRHQVSIGVAVRTENTSLKEKFQP